MIYLNMQVVYIGADHRGFEDKEKTKEYLKSEGYQVRDVGAFEYDQKDDYPDFAIKLGEAVVREKVRGILFCRSGVGVCVAANKVRGVRAALVATERQASKAREDDDVNVLCLAADMVNIDEDKKIIDAFLKTQFSPEERFVRRINKIKEYENRT